MLLAAAACLLPSLAPAATLPGAEATDKLIQEHMDAAGIVGIGATIIVDGKLAWMKGYGYADRERGTPFTPDSVMNIGSITKTFTGVALMKAVEEGKLALDEDINTYLPFKVVNPHQPGARITLRHLATHTSGITDRPSVYRHTYRYAGQAVEPLGSFLKNYFAPGGSHYAAENFLNHAPGKHREYSNIAAGLAGYIVETAVGEKLDAYTKRNIFTRLGMKNSGWALADITKGQHATLYVAQDGLTSPIAHYELTTYPDGGVRTSVFDLSRFFGALLTDGAADGKRMLSPQSVAALTRFQFDETNKPDNVDLKKLNSGLFWATKYSATRVGHNGSDPGIRTQMLATADKSLAVIVFTNTSITGPDGRRLEDINQALWKLAETLKQK